MSWLSKRFKYPLTAGAALEINGLMHEGKTVFIEVTNQDEMCQAKKILKDVGKITILRIGEDVMGHILFINWELV